jgi:DNA-binding MarR family transcriptional regulator
VLKSLIRKGYVKVKHLRESNSKRKYIYILTPKWMIERTLHTKHFIEKKVVEYNRLKEEIEALENMLSKAELQECGRKKKETNGTRL